MKKIQTNKDRLDNLKKRGDLIKESFQKEFNKIKRVDESWNGGEYDSPEHQAQEDFYDNINQTSKDEIEESNNDVNEYDNYNYPAGADADPNAPWNQDEGSEYCEDIEYLELGDFEDPSDPITWNGQTPTQEELWDLLDGINVGFIDERHNEYSESLLTLITKYDNDAEIKTKLIKMLDGFKKKGILTISGKDLDKIQLGLTPKGEGYSLGGHLKDLASEAISDGTEPFSYYERD